MILHVYALCFNEEILLPYFLRHYQPLAARVVIYDNDSTDRSRDIIKASGAECRRFQTKGEHSDRIQTMIKSTCYRESRGKADWVIVVDMDEFIYHPDLHGVLQRYDQEKVTLPLVEGFDMVSDAPPSGTGQIYHEIRMGFRNPRFDKCEVLKPEIEINFEPGCHKAKPTGPVMRSARAKIKLLHYRYLGADYLARRYELRTKRLSQDNLRHGWGVLRPPEGMTIRQSIERDFEIIRTEMPIIQVL